MLPIQNVTYVKYYKFVTYTKCYLNKMLPMQNFTYYKCYLHVYVTNTKCYQCVTIRKCTKRNIIDPIY